MPQAENIIIARRKKIVSICSRPLGALLNRCCTGLFRVKPEITPVHSSDSLSGLTAITDSRYEYNIEDCKRKSTYNRSHPSIPAEKNQF